MDPLSGRAEQISARTAAVIHIPPMETRKEDHIARGPPASNPRKKMDLANKQVFANITMYNERSYRTPPIKLRAQKLAQKFST